MCFRSCMNIDVPSKTVREVRQKTIEMDYVIYTLPSQSIRNIHATSLKRATFSDMFTWHHGKIKIGNLTCDKNYKRNYMYMIGLFKKRIGFHLGLFSVLQYQREKIIPDLCYKKSPKLCEKLRCHPQSLLQQDIIGNVQFFLESQIILFSTSFLLCGNICVLCLFICFN